MIYKSFLKRILDFVFACLAIILISPVFVVLIICGTIAMKGNPFFTQVRPGRIGKNGKERLFKILKFRSMTNEKDKDGNLLSDCKRLNGYGKFLRFTSLDELPELFNILIGDMAFIGPRPQLVEDMVFMSDEERQRHTVRPGLSGLAQTNGRNNISWKKKIEFDLEYINNITLVNDVKLIIKTIFKVFKRENVVREGTASDINFGDWLLSEGKISKEEYLLKIEMANTILREVR